MQANGRFRMVKARHARTFETALGQGKVDGQVQGLCAFIAGTKNYYTSSSCSGRIVLLERRGKRKIDTFFHRKWHREVKASEVIEALAERTIGEVWLKVDPFILHVGCPDLEHANIVLGAMKKAGVKRGGIIVAEPEKFIIEFQGTGRVEAPVKEKGKTIVPKDYLVNLVKKANHTVKANYLRLEKLEAELRKAME